MSNCNLTVVTISYNSKDTIGKTLKGIRSQKCKDFRYIVIDGGSTDGTLDIISENKDIIDFWVSEKDDGISDALNKSLKYIDSGYVLFLHSDDYFYDENSVGKIISNLSSGEDIIGFDMYRDAGRGLILQRPRGFNSYTRVKCPFCHPATICKRSLFDKIGDFDTTFKIAMDYEFFIRAYLAKASYKLVKEPLTVFSLGGISSRQNWPALLERFKEGMRAQFYHCNSIYWAVFYSLWWPSYLTYRRVRAKLQSGGRED